MRNIHIFLVSTVALFAQSRESDRLIVPGIRVGPVTRTSTEQSLRRALGNRAVKEKIDVGEGVDEPGLVLYPNDPTRRLEITWNKDQPPHPELVFICRSEHEVACKWRTAQGIGMGTSLRELEKLNGRPFEMVGWGSDVGGNLTSFQGGRLDKELAPLLLSLFPRIDGNGQYLPRLTDQEFSDVEGETFLRSEHPVLQKLNPYVGAMRLFFPSTEPRRARVPQQQPRAFGR
jgi:hypothetical protein